MLYFKLYPFTLPKLSRSFTLCIWANCCSIISQVIIYLKVLKVGFRSQILLSYPQHFQSLYLSPSHSLLSWFAQDLESLYSLQTRLNLCCFGLVCLRPSVALLVVILSPSQFFFPCFAQHLELLCSLQTCRRLNLCCFSLFNTFSLLTFLDSLFQPFVFCVETSTRSACCSVLSGSYLNTPYFRRTGSCKLIFHSPKLLSIRSKKN